MRTKLERCLAAVNEVVLGKDTQVRLAMACLLARGHLLIEDLPGMGKTTLSHTLARVLGLGFQRIQFTADLLPGDILGTSVFDQRSGSFTFHRGPIFAELVLADEINRATPKSQSALLEAMEEGQVTHEGITYSLPSPFFVIATQNPSTQSGTYSLPESQLDRFLMRRSLGYPALAAERDLLLGSSRRALVGDMQPLLDVQELGEAQQRVSAVHASVAVVDYVLRLATVTRESERFTVGLSPRGTLAMLAAARAWAWLAGRDYLIPEDVQAVAPAVAGHRLGIDVGSSSALIQCLLDEVPVL